MDGILLVSYIRRGLEEGMGTETAILQAVRAAVKTLAPALRRTCRR